ncbi:MAG: TIGR02996 domain-containing protein [Polyangiaceae bacterium]
MSRAKKSPTTDAKTPRAKGKAAPSEAAGDERSMSAAVLAAPDEDAPRMVYADWLSERGDPRGELITTQIALGRGDLASEARTKLIEAERTLLAQHGEAWVRPIGLKPEEVVLQRGWIEEVSTTADRLLDRWSTLFEACPVRALRVRKLGDKEAAALAAKSELWSRVRELEISNSELGINGLKALAAIGDKHGLRTLLLRGVKLVAKTLRMLADAGVLRPLSRLAMSGASLGSTVGPVLMESDSVSLLTELDLSDNGLGDSSIGALLARPLPRLETLNLSGTALGLDAARAFGARASHLPMLRSLSVPFFEDAMVGPLVDTPLVQRLETLRLGGSGFEGWNGTAFLRWIANAPALPLRELAVTEHYQGDVLAQALANSGALAGLERLSLAKNYTTVSGVRALLESQGLAALRELTLTGSKWKGAAAKELFSIPGWSRITALRFGSVAGAGEPLPSGTGAAIASSEHFANLRELDLRRHDIRDADVKALARDSGLRSLETLSLHSTNITASAVKELAASTALPRLRSVDLRNNKLPAAALAPLRERLGPWGVLS